MTPAYSSAPPTNSMLDVGDSTVVKTESQPSRNSSFREKLQYKETDYNPGVQWELVGGVTTLYWGSRAKNTSLDGLQS